MASFAIVDESAKVIVEVGGEDIPCAYLARLIDEQAGNSTAVWYFRTRPGLLYAFCCDPFSDHPATSIFFDKTSPLAGHRHLSLKISILTLTSHIR